MNAASRIALTLGLCLGIASLAVVYAAGEPTLAIVGQVDTPQTFTMAAFHALPHTSLDVLDVHNGKTEHYQGVPLLTLLEKAGAPVGAKLKGGTMPTVVIAEAPDGYRVAFALAELDAGLGDTPVLVADTMEGAPLDADHGPFRLVVPHDKRPARWIRGLTTVRVIVPAKAAEKP
jgi:DMSO/TMAO reductase YedYZ molybdopterin-dependent catalytic subunit